MKRARPTFETEADLCAAFSEQAIAQGWTPYPETEGWDILLVHPDGTQIGIQAKLAFNMKLIRQVLPGADALSSRLRWDIGPDFRAVLLPHDDWNASEILGALGITVFYPQVSWQWKAEFMPSLTGKNCFGKWHYWNPTNRVALPEFVPDVVAGASGPTQLTKWKIAALRIVAVLEVRGYVTRVDFKHYGLDARRWLGPDGWLVPMPERRGCYVRGCLPDFDAQHPVVYPQVLKEVRESLREGDPVQFELGAKVAA